MRELEIHILQMEAELIRLRIGSRHDFSKLEPHLLYTYAWRWGVWEQFSVQDQYRLSNEYGLVHGIQTMFSMGKSFGEGMSQAAADAVPEMIRKGAEEFARTIKPEMTEVIHEESARFVADITQANEQMNANANETISRVEGIVDKLVNSLEGMMSFFDGIKVFVESSMGKIQESIKNLLGLDTTGISLSNLLMAIRDFIIYLNIESLPLKTILLISIFNNLGLTGCAYQYFLKIITYMSTVEK
jgi:hypothetical protein